MAVSPVERKGAPAAHVPRGRTIPAMPPPTPVRCVVFDLGGVLVRLAGSWTRACEVVGLPVRGVADTPAARAVRHEFVVAHEEGRLSHAEFLDAVVRSTGGVYTPAEVDAIHRAWVLDPYPGVEELVRDLRGACVRTAILSNTNEVHWHEHVLKPDRKLRLDVDHPHASHLLGARKPRRRIYDLFAAEARVEPAHLLFFDDLADNVEGAREAGWRAERIDPAGDTAAQMRAHLVALGVLPAEAGVS